MIGVKNTLPDEKTNILTAKYDGQNYEFRPGEVTAISNEAAAHIFGYGEDDKKRALHRLGWVNWGGQLDEGLEKLGSFVFLEPEEPKFKENDSKVSQMPRKMLSGAAADTDLWDGKGDKPAEGSMNKPEGDQKQFAS